MAFGRMGSLGRGFGHLGGANAASSLGTLELSGLTSNGLASFGIINGASSGSTITSNVAGLVVNSDARTYTFDGTASAATVANGLVETLGALTQNNPVTVLPPATGTLKLSGRLFYVGKVATCMILAGYASTSVLSATSDDGTVLTVTTNRQGYPLVNGTFATPGVKIITITESLSGGGSNVSTMPIVVRDVPVAPTLAKAKVTAGRIRASRNARTPLALGATPPTITWNTGNSLVTGRSLASGGLTATTSVPEGGRGIGGFQTNPATFGQIYADTTLNGRALPSIRSKAFVFNDDRFDVRVAGTGMGVGGQILTVLYCENADEANPVWFMSNTKMEGRVSGSVSYFTVQFSSMPVRSTSRAVEILMGELTAGTSFNFRAGVVPVAFVNDKPRLMHHNDSYDFTSGGYDILRSNSVVAGERIGTMNSIPMGHRTNAWSQTGGTTGVHGLVMDRFGSNPWGYDELTRFGKLDVSFQHMSINDYSVLGFTSLGSGVAPKFNNAGGSNSFVPGPDTFANMLRLAWLRARTLQPETMIIVDVGMAPPQSQPSSAGRSIIQTTFDEVFSSDPLAVLMDLVAGQYRWMGQNFAISGLSAPFIPVGVIGSNENFPPFTAAVTASITGTTLDVSAITSGGPIAQSMYVLTPRVPVIGQLTGTSGGIGTYELAFAPGDTASGALTLYGDDSTTVNHPNDAGQQKWGELKADAALFLADKVLAA